MARRKALLPNEKSKFDAGTLKALAKDLQDGRIPLERVTVSDDMVVGLRAMITKDGRISFHASYHLGDQRPFLKIGDFTDDKKNPDRISIPDARELTNTIKHLAEMGIDPQEGLHRRLIRELKEQGTKWRPK